MARKKEEPKPLFAVKDDFVESLQNLSMKGVMLLQAVEQALDLGAVSQNAHAETVLRQRAVEFRAALTSEKA